MSAYQELRKFTLHDSYARRCRIMYNHKYLFELFAIHWDLRILRTV